MSTYPSVSELNVYPIKSTAGISLNRAFMERRGFSFDRLFMLSEPGGKFITARGEPRLLHVQCAIGLNQLHLSAPGQPELTLSFDQYSERFDKVEVWGMEAKGQHCSEEADKWFSEYLKRPAQLHYCGQGSERSVFNVQDYWTDGSLNPLNTEVGFADAYPVLVISEASLADLNARLPEPIPMARFRGNLIVSDCEPFAEDTWRRIRIGNVELVAIHGCSRCKITTTNIKTAVPSADNEPLHTLSSYRKQGDDVMFGHYFYPVNTGIIEVGASVEVMETKAPIVFDTDK